MLLCGKDLAVLQTTKFKNDIEMTRMLSRNFVSSSWTPNAAVQRGCGGTGLFRRLDL